MTMKRRDALKTLGALAGTAGVARFLPGCGGDSGTPELPSRGETLVVLMLENRSYDHVLGARALEGLPGDGLRPGMFNLDLDGKRIAPFPATREALCAIDPPHGWTAAHNQFNGGANDGFVTAHQRAHGDSRTAIEVMQYQTRETMPVTWALADAYTTCDRYFCSVMGPTWPNRMYWHTGQSSGINSNMLPVSGFNWPSIYHRLDAAGVDWSYFFGNIAVPGLIKDLPGVDAHLLPFGMFFDQARAGTLPPVVYIDPSFYVNDDHPPLHPILGQELIASIYTSLAASPQWKDCTFLVTYDEHGGFFDHVPPPTTVDEYASTGFDQMGFRVPTMVIGPYVKEGHVSSVVYDHTSVLRHIERRFSLGALTKRSSAANDLDDCFDLERKAKGAWSPPVMIPTVDVSSWPMSPVCTPGGGDGKNLVAPHDHPVLQAADDFPDLLGRWDRRGQEGELQAQITRELAASQAELQRRLEAAEPAEAARIAAPR
jgi:phospholipase C